MSELNWILITFFRRVFDICKHFEVLYVLPGAHTVQRDSTLKGGINNLGLVCFIIFGRRGKSNGAWFQMIKGWNDSVVMLLLKSKYSLRIPKNELVIIKSGHPDSYWILTLKVLHPLVSSFPEIVPDLQQKVPYFGNPHSPKETSTIGYLLMRNLRSKSPS